MPAFMCDIQAGLTIAGYGAIGVYCIRRGDRLIGFSLVAAMATYAALLIAGRCLVR